MVTAPNLPVVVEAPVTAAIQKLFRTDRIARDFFISAAERKLAHTETPIDSIITMAGNCRHADAIELMKRLDYVKAGRFIVGRSNHKTRMEWFFSIASLGKAAVAAPANVKDIPNVVGEAPGYHPPQRPDRIKTGQAVDTGGPFTIAMARAQLSRALGVTPESIRISVDS